MIFFIPAYLNPQQFCNNHLYSGITIRDQAASWKKGKSTLVDVTCFFCSSPPVCRDTCPSGIVVGLAELHYSWLWRRKEEKIV
jgi:hypothetical protein